MLYPIRNVSEMTGIPSVTIRAWENRYGLVNPVRTAGGHRLYGLQDIETLIAARAIMRERGLSIGAAARMLLAKSEPGSAANDGEAGSSSDLIDDYVRRLHASLVAMKNARSHETLDCAFSRLSFENVLCRILVPVMRRICEAWESGKIDAAQEHFATQLLLQRCNPFLRLLPVDPELPRAAAFCPEGEQRHLNLMLFALFLRKHGFEVVYLGPHTPLSGLTPFLIRSEIAVVVTALNEPSQTQTLARWLISCRGQAPGMVFAVLTGSELRRTPGALAPYVLGTDPEEWRDWIRSACSLPFRGPM
jgi:MerR family transcriptional regulator, light-induced transcriptional regulator